MNQITYSVTNKHVTLGDGIVTFSATLTDKNGSVYDAQIVWKPYISNGVLIFGFQSATVNAKTATSADRSTFYHAHRYIVRDAIRDYIRKQVGGTFQYVSLTVTLGMITFQVNVYSM